MPVQSSGARTIIVIIILFFVNAVSISGCVIVELATKNKKQKKNRFRLSALPRQWTQTTGGNYFSSTPAAPEGKQKSPNERSTGKRKQGGGNGNWSWLINTGG